MALPDLDKTIDDWIATLQQYSLAQLCARPTEEDWSMGQLYNHLIADTLYYIEQIETCLSTDENSMEEATLTGKALLLKNDFPDERMKGDPANAFIPQPVSKELLFKSLLDLKAAMNAIATKIKTTNFHGKALHPGFNYFSAGEWFQFAGMHFRHHLRQKARLESFWQTNHSIAK